MPPSRVRHKAGQTGESDQQLIARAVEGRTKEYIDLLSNAAESATEEVQEAARETVVEAVKKSA